LRLGHPPKTRISAQAVGAGAEEFEEAEVAEDLELLADFVADVCVVGWSFARALA